MAIELGHRDRSYPITPIASPTLNTKFTLPDLFSHCPFPLVVNKHCRSVSRASEKWFLDAAVLSKRRSEKFMGLKGGELAAVCYTDADEDALRICADFNNWLFNMDDWSDEFDLETHMGMRECVMAAMRDPKGFKTDKVAAKLAQIFCVRMIDRAGPRCYARFLRTMDDYFAACEKQTAHRVWGVTPDLETYIAIREDTSGCRAGFVMNEFSDNLDLPEEVTKHPVFLALEQATNAFVSWSNDIFSYDVEQRRNDTHNMVAVVMEHSGYTLQEAVDFVSDLCKRCVQRFETARGELPSWGAEVDEAVQKYATGLQHWISGSLFWSFETERYFGKGGQEVLRTMTVHLSPKQPLDSQSPPSPIGGGIDGEEKGTTAKIQYTSEQAESFVFRWAAQQVQPQRAITA